jgi:hypothetical protein
LMVLVWASSFCIIDFKLHSSQQEKARELQSPPSSSKYGVQ